MYKFLLLYPILNLSALFCQSVYVGAEGENEPSIHANPERPGEILLATNTDNVYFSKDSGTNWKKLKVSSKHGIYGDPVVFISSKGQYYYCHLSATKNKFWPEMFDRIVFQSSNSDFKWSKGTGIGSPEYRYKGKKWATMHDKPWFSVNEYPGSAAYGRIHLSWTRFDAYKSSSPLDSSVILHCFSDNRGKTFSKPIIISDIKGDCADGDYTLEGATTCVLPSGKVLCVFSGRNQLWLDRSEDGGLNWGKDRVLDTMPGGWSFKQKGFMRSSGLPFIVSSGQTVAACWADERKGLVNVSFKISYDGGINWEATQTVNSIAGSSTHMPHLCFVDSVTLAIVYYRSKDQVCQVELARIHIPDNSISYHVLKHFQVSNGNSNDKVGLFMGDYIGICRGFNSGECLLAYTVTSESGETRVIFDKFTFK